MVLHIFEKFNNNILNGFQLTEGTQVHGRNDYVPYSKGNNSKRRQSELQIMCSAHLFIVLYICVKFRENILDGIRVMERTYMMEALMDRQTLKFLDGIT